DALESLEDTFGSGEQVPTGTTDDFEPDGYETDPDSEFALAEEAPSIDEVDDLTEGLLDQLVDVVDDPADVDPDDLDFDLG
ncbi:MAG: hypothetical protein AAFN30_09190, partial [Actinomycetota bacterium]